MASIADSVPRRRWGSVWDPACILIIFLTCAIASGFAWHEIESIIVSGTTLSVISLIMLARVLFVARLRTMWWPGLAFSLAGPIFSLLIWVTIYLNRWSPTDATRNGVPLMCTMYTAFVVAFGCFAWTRLPKADPES